MTNKKTLDEKSKQALTRQLRLSAAKARADVKLMKTKAQEFQKDIKKLGDN